MSDSDIGNLLSDSDFDDDDDDDIEMSNNNHNNRSSNNNRHNSRSLSVEELLLQEVDDEEEAGPSYTGLRGQCNRIRSGLGRFKDTELSIQCEQIVDAGKSITFNYIQTHHINNRGNINKRTFDAQAITLNKCLDDYIKLKKDAHIYYKMIEEIDNDLPRRDPGELEDFDVDKYIEEFEAKFANDNEVRYLTNKFKEKQKTDLEEALQYDEDELNKSGDETEDIQDSENDNDMDMNNNNRNNRNNRKKRLKRNNSNNNNNSNSDEDILIEENNNNYNNNNNNNNDVDDDLGPENGKFMDPESDDEDISIVKNKNDNTGNKGFKCPLTNDFLDKPVKNKNCGHYYSQEAVMDYIKGRNNTCPNVGCEASLTKDCLESDIRMERQVKKMKLATLEHETMEMDQDDDDDLDLS